MLRLLTDEDVHGDIVVGLRRRPARPWIWYVSKTSDYGTPPIPLFWNGRPSKSVSSFPVDKKPVAVYAWDRVARGLPMPGVAILRILLSIGQAINQLELITVAANPDDFRDQVIYLPI